MKDVKESKKSTQGYVAIGLSVIAVILAVILFFEVHGRKKIVYVELRKVFSEFEMAKSYDQRLKSTSSARKAYLDSLEINLRAEAQTIKASNLKSGSKVDEFLYNKESYIGKRKQFEEDNDALQRQYNGEITKQLNQYIRDYGEKHGYDLILGAEGSGVMMYAKPDMEITDDILKYVNERYKGAAK